MAQTRREARQKTWQCFQRAEVFALPPWITREHENRRNATAVTDGGERTAEVAIQAAQGIYQ
jgi:hypothetical protein